MVRLAMILLIGVLVLWLWALISCLSAEPGEVRTLPRWAWVLIILLIPLAGSVLYLLAGRPVATGAPSEGFWRLVEGFWRPGEGWRSGSGAPESEHPRPLAPDDDPEFLRRLKQQTRNPELRKPDDTPPADP